MKFYKDRFNKWHNEESFLNMMNIFKPCFFNGCSYKNVVDLVCNDTKVFQEEPSVIDYLLMDMRLKAIKRYRDIHGCDLLEARDMVEKIEKDMEEFKK